MSGRFYTNNLENAHMQQKRKLKETEAKNVAEVNTSLSGWIDEFYSETVRALRGQGKYRLAIGYEHFFVESVQWNRWTPQRRQQHVDTFLNFVLSQSQFVQEASKCRFKKSPSIKKES